MITDDPSQIGNSQTIVAQVANEVQLFRDELEARRPLGVQNPKRQPRIVDTIVSLQAPGNIGGQGGILGGTGGDDGEGACCNYDEDSCTQMTEAACVAAGGDFKGPHVPCDPDPCGACCPDSNDACNDNYDQDACEADGGTWTHGIDCDPDPCGACCTDGVCDDATNQSDCEDGGGTWTHGIDCDPDPCGSCKICGDRITAIFSGAPGCLDDFTWPMGQVDGDGETSITWSALADGGFGNLSGWCSYCDGHGGSDAGVTVICNTEGNSWSIDAPDFFAMGEGALPLDTEIDNQTIGQSGTITISCGGEWGACCMNDDDGCGAQVCWGCDIPSTGFHGGFGPDQCSWLANCLYFCSGEYLGDHTDCGGCPSGIC